MTNAEIIDWKARAIAAEQTVENVRQYIDWQSQDEYLNKDVQAGSTSVIRAVRQILNGEELIYGT